MSESYGLHSWFAVEIRRNRERAVADLLRAKGLDTFPTYEEPRQWSDHVKLTEFPLFPGYPFCRLTGERRMPILRRPGCEESLALEVPKYRCLRTRSKPSGVL